MKRPVVGFSPDLKQPVVPDNLKQPINWAFSFKYFDQIKYFGLSRANPNWFVSLLERLKDLCGKEKETSFRDKKFKQDYRYHEVDWNHKNVPIKRAELNWVDRHYLENETEFPFFQFQISKANGRIVGFWDENSTVFYVVLLDPLHNIQPSKYHSYKVDDCDVLSCQYSSLLKDVDDIVKRTCEIDNCPTYSRIRELPTRGNETNIIIAFIDNDYLEQLEETLETKSISEVLEAGILFLSN